MPKVQYLYKNIRSSTWQIISQANKFIEEYQAAGYVLTLRQLYYRFVAADLISNEERSYKNLGNAINTGRLIGQIDWNAIEDRGRGLLTWNGWRSPESAMRSTAYKYRWNGKWRNQPAYVEVWVEKQALESVVGRACSKFEVPHLACKGYLSQSEMWRASGRVDQQINKETIIIHLGDHDPSGIDMTSDNEYRLSHLFGTPVRFIRLALNMNQIEEHKPPPNPAKVTDSRYKQYVRDFGSSCWELDALPPEVLDNLISEELKKWIDVEQWELDKKKERVQIEFIEEAANNYGRVKGYLNELCEAIYHPVDGLGYPELNLKGLESWYRSL
jgi:hypothetical protein